MSGKKFFRITIAASMLLIILLACSLTSTSVNCNTPALIAAINNANTNPAVSTLELAPGCTYTLTAVDNTATSSFNGSTFEYGDNGLPQITTPIIINGNDAIIRRASDSPNFRIFFITETGSLTLNDVTLENGLADDAGRGSAFPSSGGAIYNAGSYLEVNNSTLQNNQAAFHGGAIFGIDGSSTYITDSIIHSNIAPRGGGIFIYHAGLLSIDASEITANSATTSGGGINLEHGAELIVSDSLVASNHADRHGGGIFKDGGADHLATTISGTTFQENTADWSGGGVFIWRSPLTITDSQFSENQADEYGGGLGYQNDASETVSISGTTFDNNTALLEGGAIHFSGELMTISGCSIQNNLAENGAGIHNGTADDSKYISRTDSELILTSSTVTENAARGYGGGAFNEGVMTCGESNFIVNESFTLGGGIHNTGELEVAGCTFDKNETGFDGGGINSYNIADIRGSTFTNNSATRGGGFASIGGDAEVNQSTFTNNSASDRGGAIFNFGAVPGAAVMQIMGCSINNNTSTYGGGIATSLGDTKISSSIIASNESSAEGGGIYNDGLMSVELSILSNNEAITLGGGIHNINEISVSDTTFRENLAGADGGGFNTYDIASITSSTFVGNNALRGGGLASVGGDTTLTNVTISANTAVDSGGGLFNMGPLIGDISAGGGMQANHITVANNSAPTGGGIATSGGLLSIKNSIVAYSPIGSDCKTTTVDTANVGENIDSDNTCTGFTLTDDPLLDILANYGGSTETHALKVGSPAIDAAPDCTTLAGAVLLFDQRGIARPGGPLCDLGAYEDEIGEPLLPAKSCTYTANINLFCRLGPDPTRYAVVDSFVAGQSATVVGITWDKLYVYVEGPNNGLMCAVPTASRFGTLDGDCEDLIVIREEDIIIVEEEDTPQPGCTVQDPNGGIRCEVPCPPNAYPGEPCTP